MSRLVYADGVRAFLYRTIVCRLYRFVRCVRRQYTWCFLFVAKFAFVCEIYTSMINK